MITNAKIETVFTSVFFQKEIQFFEKSEFEYKFIAMDKEQAIQNKKRSIRERRQERNRVETEEQKVGRLRKKKATPTKAGKLNRGGEGNSVGKEEGSLQKAI